jgi:hypothetical protein
MFARLLPLCWKFALLASVGWIVCSWLSGDLTIWRLIGLGYCRCLQMLSMSITAADTLRHKGALTMYPKWMHHVPWHDKHGE